MITIESSEKHRKEFTLDTTDGMKLIDDKGWVHIRKSNTEPIVRLIIEAKSKKILNQRLDYFRNLLQPDG